MKKLKDFFYNKNDIFIVIIIVAIAGFIIYTRVGSIMTYPETQSEKIAVSQPSSTASVQTEETKEPTQTDDSSDKNEPVSITIEDSDTSTSVCEKLESAGLISSASEFESYIADEEKTSSLQNGTFEIPKGSSHEEILKIITQ